MIKNKLSGIARPGDTVFVRPGVYHQSVQIRRNGITLRGSGAFHGGTVLVPPRHIPRTLCNTGFGPTGVFIRHARHVLVSGNVVSGNCRASWSSTTGSAAARVTPPSGTTVSSTTT